MVSRGSQHAQPPPSLCPGEGWVSQQHLDQDFSTGEMPEIRGSNSSAHTAERLGSLSLALCAKQWQTQGALGRVDSQHLHCSNGNLYWCSNEKYSRTFPLGYPSHFRLYKSSSQVCSKTLVNFLQVI